MVLVTVSYRELPWVTVADNNHGPMAGTTWYTQGQVVQSGDESGTARRRDRTSKFQSPSAARSGGTDGGKRERAWVHNKG